MIKLGEWIFIFIIIFINKWEIFMDGVKSFNIIYLIFGDEKIFGEKIFIEYL